MSEPRWLDLPGASAPGKLMVSGEYAVLDGVVSVVAAVAARAVARWAERSELGSTIGSAEKPFGFALPPEAATTRELAEQAVGKVDADLHIDVTDLRKSGRKLGLGSSSAASAAVAGAVYAAAGHDPSHPDTRRAVFETALRGHKAIAPEGSGADVAAAGLGGYVRFRLEGKQLAEAESTELPGGVITRVVWTGKEARTNEFVRSVKAAAERDPEGAKARLAAMRETADAFVAAIARGDAAGVVQAAGKYGEHMATLGEASGVSIVTPELRTIAELAREAGGSAKPSGAGGGDVAIAFFADADSAARFESACDARGLDLLDLDLGDEGVRIERF